MYLSNYFNCHGGENSWLDDTERFQERESQIQSMRGVEIENGVREIAAQEGIRSNHVISFLERSMSRFESWITHPTVSTCQITANKDELSLRQNQKRNKQLRLKINSMGYSTQLVKGTYTDRAGNTYDEWSWFVIGRRVRKGEEPVDTPEDEFEKEMVRLAKAYDQDSIIVTKPSKGLIKMVFPDGKQRPVVFKISRFGADAFNHMNSMRKKGLSYGGTKIKKNSDDKVWSFESLEEEELCVFPISMPGKTRVFGPARFWRDGLAEDGREDLCDTVDYFFSRGESDLSDEWWPNTRKSDRILIHEMQDQILELVQDVHYLEDYDDVYDASEELGDLLGDFKKKRQEERGMWCR